MIGRRSVTEADVRLNPSIHRARDRVIIRRIGRGSARTRFRCYPPPAKRFPPRFEMRSTRPVIVAVGLCGFLPIVPGVSSSDNTGANPVREAKETHLVRKSSV